MYKLCKTEQSAQRQRQLEEGLLTAMKTRRYEEITISDLCAQMEIPRKSFYRYFSSKDGALYALIDHTLEDFERRTSTLHDKGKGDIYQDLRNFFEFWREQKPLLDVLAHSGISVVLIHRALLRAQSDHVRTIYSASMEQTAMQQYAATFAICGQMSMVTRWHRSGYSESPEEMAKIATALLTKPLVQI